MVTNQKWIFLESFTQTWGKPCILRYLHKNALQKPQTRCSSGLCRPRLREQRRSHKHSGCVRQLPPLLLSASRPRLSLKTLSRRCWQSHFAATYDSQSCESPLNKKMEESLLQQVFSWSFCRHYLFLTFIFTARNQHTAQIILLFRLNLSLKSPLELLKCGFTNYV